MQPPQFEKKSFWKRPEGVTGLLFLAAIAGGVGFLVATSFGAIMAALSNTLVLAATLAALGVLVYVVVDPKTRALMSYMYKSVMRSITGLFVNLDPIGILKSYVEEMEKNISKLREQLGKIRGQSRQLQTLMERNAAEIENQLKLAKIAQERGKKQPMILSSRKAARLKESNAKYAALRKKIDILYRILTRMHDNSEVLLEDTKDQVRLKEVERKAIRASHGAMKSAMSVINGQPDQRAMFDQAMEHIADDVANKVGEMERFMEMSSEFMTSIDLQNGVFEEQGMAMLEAYEKQSELLLSGGHIQADESLDLDSRRAEPEAQTRRATDSGESSNYDQFF